MRLRLVPPRANKLQLYYPFAELEAARREAVAAVHDDDLKRLVTVAVCGTIALGAMILGAVYLR